MSQKNVAVCLMVLTTVLFAGTATLCLLHPSFFLIFIMFVQIAIYWVQLGIYRRFVP